MEGQFMHLWNNPPAPFNPDFIPNNEKLYFKLNTIMQNLEPFNSREERKDRRKIEYDKLIATGKYPTIKEIKGEQNGN